MARVVPISRAHHYRRKRRRKVQHKILLSCGCLLALALLAVQNVSPSSFRAAEQESPRAINGGQAWGGFKEPGMNGATAPRGGLFSLEGRVTRVRDGDTIVVGRTPVRIANLDCAETGTARGDRATRRVKAFVAGGTVSCRLHGRQSHDRQIGVCSLSDGRDLGATLIDEGFCERWRG